jgi:hypothetical protein
MGSFLQVSPSKPCTRLFQATTVTILSSSEGQAGEIWEPSHKAIFFRAATANIEL